MFIYKHILLFTNHVMKKTKSSRYHYCSNVGNNEDSNVFLVKLIDILVNFLYIFVDLGKLFFSFFFIWTKYEKKK
jgi:hypothetical protein